MTANPKKLLVATHNLGKVKEIADILADMAISWLSLRDVSVNHNVEEVGSTFMENAVLKAESYAANSGLLTLADDSGLEVSALAGLPGVRTARYGGPGLSAEERYQYLLNQMSRVGPRARSARFRCVVALADAGGVIGTASGVCEGEISLGPAGGNGFGYDPIFYLPELGRTMAELTPEEKHAVSHRGQALHALEPLLRLHLTSGDAR